MLKIFTIYDSKVNTYKQPFTLNSTGEATRQFIDAINSPDSFLAKSPSDYTLFEIGTFNTDTGITTQLEAKISLGTAIEFINS
jgi:hypothetical protein